MSKCRGKKPSYSQRKMLEAAGKDSVDWLYIGTETENLGGGKCLSKNGDKLIVEVFENINTGDQLKIHHS